MGRKSSTKKNRRLANLAKLYPSPREAAPSPRGAVYSSHESVAVRKYSRFSGPVPSPEMLAAYEQVHSGAAGIIMGEFAAQGSHRRSMERWTVRGNVISQVAGVVIAGTIALGGLYGGYLLLQAGKSIEGFTSMFGPISILAGVFIFGKRHQTAALARKMAADLVGSSSDNAESSTHEASGERSLDIVDPDQKELPLPQGRDQNVDA